MEDNIYKAELEKVSSYLDTAYWLYMRDDLKGIIKESFAKKQYNTIAIYGMGKLGEMFAKFLKDIDAGSIIGIDKNADSIVSCIEVVYPDECYIEPDVVIVSSYYYFSDIVTFMKDRVNCPIISLEEVVFSI